MGVTEVRRGRQEPACLQTLNPLFFLFSKPGAPATCPVMLCTHARAHMCEGSGQPLRGWGWQLPRQLEVGGAFEGHAHFSSVWGKLVR